MRPKSFDFQFAPCCILGEGEELKARPEAIRHIAVHFHRHFAVPALGLYDTRESDELVRRSSVSYSRISSTTRLRARTPVAVISARRARATRPCLPITLPTSVGATVSSKTVGSPSI